MVCRNGGGTKAVRQRQDLRESEATQPKHAERSPSTSESGRDPGSTHGSQDLLKARCQQRIMADPLAQSSRLLTTTFITSMGRYRINKLPFCMSSAPKHFQRRMSELLTGLQGVQCQMDDILVFGKDEAEHNSLLQAVLHRIEDAGVTLNPEKCKFKKKELTFLGHRIDPEGIRADPEKTAAIRKMYPPTSVPELRRFMRMVNQLGKFIPNLAKLTQPLRELLSKSTAWVWDSAQSRAFDQVKEELSKPTTLAVYDPQCTHEALGRCILARRGSNRTPAIRRCVETSLIHITVHVGD